MNESLNVFVFYIFFEYYCLKDIDDEFFIIRSTSKGSFSNWVVLGRLD